MSDKMIIFPSGGKSQRPFAKLERPRRALPFFFLWTVSAMPKNTRTRKRAKDIVDFENSPPGTAALKGGSAPAGGAETESLDPSYVEEELKDIRTQGRNN